MDNPDIELLMVAMLLLDQDEMRNIST